MSDFRRRLSACAVILVSSIVVTQTQQQQERGRDQQRSRADRAAAAGGAVASVDADGVPKFVWAAGARPGPVDATHDGAARWHLRQFAPAFDVTSEDVSATDTVSVQPLKSGDVIVQLRQRYRGVEVMGSDVKVMMRPDHQLVAISGRPRATGGAEMRFERSREAALAAALSAQFGSPVSASNIGIETMASGEERFRLAPGSRLYMSEAAPVRPVMFPVGGRLVAAYVMEFYAGTLDSVDSMAFLYVIAADDGRVLQRRDLTVSEKRHDPPPPPPVDFLYRVYAEPGNQRPLDGPQQDISPHPTGFPDGTTSPFLPSNLVTMGGFNDPPSGVPDPWLSPDATETNGNNADAYVDFSAPDGLTPGVDFRADVTSARSFDRTYDTTLGPTATVDQSKAAITNAFYTVNWLHDYWYGSGFDEAAGNAQLNNYGRGGVEGDPMRVEVQDNFLGGSRNNANMSSPSDGMRPRMQMYTWFGELQATLTLTPGGNVTNLGVASFGPANFTIEAPVALANDGVGVATDACEPLPALTGQIVLVDRGICAFTFKARNVQAAGGVGIIIANNAPAPFAPGGTDPLVTIGVLGITQAAGTAIKTSLLAGPVTARMFRRTGTERDGAIDNTIVAHEWGHYLHHRLADCGQFQCAAMSEGWADFVAMHTIARDGDNLNGTYAVATYSTSAFDPNSAYFGIRRVPYSVDFTKNALTFKHITDGVALPPVPTLPGGPNSEVHNAGEIWATMLWEGYVALQKARGRRDSFDDVRRRMADYIVGGLKMTPADATYTEQRDALLAAASSRSDDDDDHRGFDASNRQSRGARRDMLTLAQAFARRGAGTCAVSPARDSMTFSGVVESFEVSPRIGLGEIRLEEDKSCDRDGFVDAGERGTIVVPVMNSGPVEMRNTMVSITTSTPGVSFRHGSSARILRIDPFTTREAEIEIEVDRTFSGIGKLTLNVNVSNGESCDPVVSRTFNAWINVDEALNVSNVDTVETPTTPWTAAGADADVIWTRPEVTPFNRAWFGLDFAGVSDTTLTSPALQVGSTPFVVEFDHKFGFETNGGVAPFFDGGVIEISGDNGATWADVNTLVTPGYGGTIFVGSGNPLGGRPAFVGRNAAFPARNHLTLNFGTAFAGKTVRVRFRIGTDEAAADIGWEIDNIAFQGITNKPFAEFIADLAKCVPKKDK